MKLTVRGKIARKTDLLALNAAVEAARAGDLFIGHTESVAGLAVPVVAETSSILRKPA